MSEWIKTDEQLPPEGEEVMTKMDDQNGERNVQSLRFQGCIWWLPDGSMYVYYYPTHWKPMA